MSISTQEPQLNNSLRTRYEREGERHLMKMKSNIKGDLDTLRDEFLGEILQKDVSEADLAKLKKEYPHDKLFILLEWQEDLLTHALLHDETAIVNATNNGDLGMEYELTKAQTEDWLNQEAQILRDQQKCNESFAILVQDPSPSKLLVDVRQNCADKQIKETLLTKPPHEIYQRLGGELAEKVSVLFERKKKRKIALNEAIEQGRINQTWAKGCMQLRLTQSF